MKDNHTPVTPETSPTQFPVLLAAGLLCLTSACAGPRALPPLQWLPPSDGWAVRDVDERQPPRWVVYERDALVADVKEFRIVGLVDAKPEVVARALRYRLLDEQYLPEGMQQWEILRESETEVDIYGRTGMPFPFNDREVTERLRFTHDARTGVHTVEAKDIDPGVDPAPGVLRIPVVQNRFEIAPAGGHRSVVTIDTVHDIGGNFPNWVIYRPVCKQLVKDIALLNELSAAGRGRVQLTSEFSTLGSRGNKMQTRLQ